MEAKEKGGEIIKQEKEIPILNIIFALILHPLCCRRGDRFSDDCPCRHGHSSKAGGVTSISPQKVTTTSTEVTREIKGGTMMYMTSVGINIPNAVFEIKH
ncbi:hypothetical protein N0V84_004490 [Fusarium piperis]|uniref:Uncharacterized protein n=1 Tax=Fusarium piperis TaxID=1435070 RepID=A0A9W8WFE3_9HYPO|nr:hypothetical protein N0V84_004490 [Fusarium piperis]